MGGMGGILAGTSLDGRRGQALAHRVFDWRRVIVASSTSRRAPSSSGQEASPPAGAVGAGYIVTRIERLIRGMLVLLGLLRHRDMGGRSCAPRGPALGDAVLLEPLQRHAPHVPPPPLLRRVDPAGALGP
jgi:hypothetical protein